MLGELPGPSDFSSRTITFYSIPFLHNAGCEKPCQLEQLDTSYGTWGLRGKTEGEAGWLPLLAGGGAGPAGG